MRFGAARRFFPRRGKSRAPARGRRRESAYFFAAAMGGWVFFIQASWTIIMTWFVDH